MCLSKQEQSANEVQADPGSCEEVADVFIMTAPGKKIMKDVIIDGHALLMQVDTGSDATIIPNNFWKKWAVLNSRKLVFDCGNLMEASSKRGASFQL